MSQSENPIPALKDTEPSCFICEHYTQLALERPCVSCEGWLNFKLNTDSERIAEK